jgi:hypothetical protein
MSTSFFGARAGRAARSLGLQQDPDISYPVISYASKDGNTTLYFDSPAMSEMLYVRRVTGFEEFCSRPFAKRM